jgi:tetratricopeptide (TPR) repeat protein
MRKARSLVVRTDEPQIIPGSITDVAARLALWGRRAPKGLARVEFVSDFSRQAVISELRAILPQHIPIHEIELPFQQPAVEVVRFLRARLCELPSGVVSITGFATAFSEDQTLADSLQVLNFHRENLAQFPLCQIWWMTFPFSESFLRSVPDLDSWFMLRLNLSEIIADKSVEAPYFLDADSSYNPDEARKQSTAYVARFEKAINNYAHANSVIHLAFVATSLLGNASLEQEEQELAITLLERMMPLLQQQGLIKEELQSFHPKINSTAVFGADYFGLIENFRMLGQLCECAGKTYEAELFYEASLNTAENSGWRDFGILGLAFHTLTQFYIRLNRLPEAESLCKRWIGIQESNSDLDSYYILYPLDELLEISLLANQYENAERIYYRMLSISRKTSIPAISIEKTLMNNMSWLYKRLGRYAEAKALSQHAD